MRSWCELSPHPFDLVLSAVLQCRLTILIGTRPLFDKKYQPVFDPRPPLRKGSFLSWFGRPKTTAIPILRRSAGPCAFDCVFL